MAGDITTLLEAILTRVKASDSLSPCIYAGSDGSSIGAYEYTGGPGGWAARPDGGGFF